MNQPYLIWAAAFRHVSPRSCPCSRSCFAIGDWVLDAARLGVVGWLACPDDEMKLLQKMMSSRPIILISSCLNKHWNSSSNARNRKRDERPDNVLRFKASLFTNIGSKLP